jgi:hypothetical protein
MLLFMLLQVIQCCEATFTVGEVALERFLAVVNSHVRE